MINKQFIQQNLERHNQGHLLRFYDQLPPEGQAALLEQIARLDLAKLERLVEQYVRQAPSMAIGGRIEPPAIIPARPGEGGGAKLHADGRRVGEEVLRAGKVAAFVVAGGQGTRLGYEGPKGCLECTPVAKKPLFQLHAEKILAASRRYGVTIPWYVMTSPANDVVTRAFFRRNRFFALGEGNVFFLVQGTMPALDLEGKVLLAAPGELSLSPNGHGGSLEAQGWRRPGGHGEARVEYISYFQVDNPLVKAVDPLFIGLHAMQGRR